MASGQGHGRMSLGMKLIRLLIVILTVVFVIVGAVLLAIGIFIIKDPKMQQLRPLLTPDISAKYAQNLSQIEVFAIVLIAIGGVLFLLGFLGCCGAMKSFRCLHVLYAIIVGAIILVEIALLIVFFVNQNRFKSEFVHKLQQSIVTYYVGPPTGNATVANSISLAWDLAQFNLQCCGAAGKTDYINATNWNRTNPYRSNATLTVPFTCCPVNATRNWNGLPANMSEANACATTGVNAYAQGCYERLSGLMFSYKDYVIVGVAIIGTVEVFALLFAIILFCRRSQ